MSSENKTSTTSTAVTKTENEDTSANETTPAAPPPPATAPTTFQFYRKSSIGEGLRDALDQLIQNNNLPCDLAATVFEHFDRAIEDALNHKVKSKASFKGHLHTYRFCDNVWTFILENANFRTDQETIHVDKVKIVAVDGKNSRADGLN
eukprot:TRINITY_DN1359_c0_g3_i1.p1 TRINITY_DN1359_c0_g3~~TRINITY_DN1359_c0_g3_i1.p1  ORF type:complete len:149 (-),score=39.74 TRINITY_DN1359_c0_g3_i1:497-943(-)